mmetsp:Transcript_24487/g.65765  ORF Transcript_24487/g.65765 Transcript_24487/m.65765 type:complete len:210 (+) Transcript_24487:638-1267(+)
MWGSLKEDVAPVEEVEHAIDRRHKRKQPHLRVLEERERCGRIWHVDRGLEAGHRHRPAPTLHAVGPLTRRPEGHCALAQRRSHLQDSLVDLGQQEDRSRLVHRWRYWVRPGKGSRCKQACRPNDCFGREVDATHVPGILELELGRGDENDARAPTSKELVERLIPHRAIIETIADPHEQLRSVALARPTMLKQRPCKHRRVSNDHEIEP